MSTSYTVIVKEEVPVEVEENTGDKSQAVPTSSDNIFKRLWKDMVNSADDIKVLFDGLRNVGLCVAVYIYGIYVIAELVKKYNFGSNVQMVLEVGVFLILTFLVFCNILWVIRATQNKRGKYKMFYFSAVVVMSGFTYVSVLAKEVIVDKSTQAVNCSTEVAVTPE